MSGIDRNRFVGVSEQDLNELLAYNISGRKSNDLDINFKNIPLNRVKNTKILGITFDERLSFQEHINCISTKVKNRINFLSRNRYLFPTKTINTIYKSLVLPVINYGIAIYGHTYASHLIQLERLQRRAARFISLTTPEDYKIAYRDLNWMSFRDSVSYFSGIYIYKCLNCFISNQTKDYFRLISTNHQTRGQTNESILLPNYRLTACLNSVFYCGVKTWNRIDSRIRAIDEYKVFVRKLKDFFLLK